MSDSTPVDEHPVFDFLRQGVPLSLLCDLALPVDSTAMLQAEPADATWIQSARSA